MADFDPEAWLAEQDAQDEFDPEAWLVDNKVPEDAEDVETTEEFDPAQYIAMEEAKDVNELDAVLASVAQGLTMGFSDEMIAWLQSSTDEEYDKALEVYHARQDAIKEKHPKLAFFMDSAASIAGPGKFLKGGKMLKKAVMLGAAEGAGRADEGEKLEGAAIGATIGGVAGAIPGAVSGTKKLAKGVKSGELVEGLKGRMVEKLAKKEKLRGALEKTMDFKESNLGETLLVLGDVLIGTGGALSVYRIIKSQAGKKLREELGEKGSKGFIRDVLKRVKKLDKPFKDQPAEVQAAILQSAGKGRKRLDPFTVRSVKNPTTKDDTSKVYETTKQAKARKANPKDPFKVRKTHKGD